MTNGGRGGGRGWYAVPIVLAVLGLLLVAGGVVGLVVDHGQPLTPLPAGSTVQARAGGFGLYASGGRRGLQTYLVTRPGGRSVELTRPSGTNTITKDGRTWTEVARTSDTLPAGRYTVSCQCARSSLAIGPRGFGPVGIGIVALVIGVFLLVLAGLVGVPLILIRRIRNRRAGTSALGALYGPQR